VRREVRVDLPRPRGPEVTTSVEFSVLEQELLASLRET
jgi:hypothetical protein